ncbi:Stomatin-Like Protein 2 [Manis pentadactyla]|nr:Stomatin-Like Protein 2 [Manis pentadactyla]
MTDVEVDYVSSGDINADAECPETLALRKELVRLQIYLCCEGECMIEFEDKAEIWVTSKMKVKCQILAPGLGLELVVRDISITDRVRFWIRCNGESKMVDQGYIEAWLSSMFQVTSMLTLRVQVKGTLFSDVAADGVVSGRMCDSVPGLQRGKGDIHDDGGVSGHWSMLGLGLCNR